MASELTTPSTATSSSSMSTSLAMNTNTDDSSATERRGEKRHADDTIVPTTITPAVTTLSSSVSSTPTVASSPSGSTEKKDEVKQPITKKAKKKKQKKTTTDNNGNDDDDEKGEGEKKKAKGYAKSQRANKLALGIPDQPVGLEIFNLVRPVNIPAAFEFFKSIGSPKYVVAPMVNQSELAFRLLTRRYGATLCYTPMMHAKLFSKSDRYRTEQFQTTPADRPLFAQFCANDPQQLLDAARHLEGKCDAVDINFGCPQGIARRGNYGSFLLNRPQILRALVTILHNYLNLPVTVKIRILPKLEDTITMAKMLEACGARLITVHGRTKEQLKDKTGPNDFAVIARLKKELNVPVLSNGGIETYEDVQTALATTGVDGIMTSEGILGNPAIFAGPALPNAVTISREYLSLARQYPADSSAVRAHLIKFLFRELSVHTDIRQMIAEHKDPVNCDALLDEIERRDKLISAEEHEARVKKIPTWYRRFNPLPGQVRSRDFDKEGAPQDQKSDASAGAKGTGTAGAGVGMDSGKAIALARDRAAKKAAKKQKKKEAAAQRTERLAAREGITPKEYEQSLRYAKNARKDAQRRAAATAAVAKAAAAALQLAATTATAAVTPTTTIPSTTNTDTTTATITVTTPTPATSAV